MEPELHANALPLVVETTPAPADRIDAVASRAEKTIGPSPMAVEAIVVPRLLLKTY
jgi:hypothetical protein